MNDAPPTLEQCGYPSEFRVRPYPPDLGLLGQFVEALRCHVFLRAAFRSKELAARAVVRAAIPSVARASGCAASGRPLHLLAGVMWDLDLCVKEGAYDLGLVIEALPFTARAGATLSVCVGACVQLGMRPASFVEEASRSLVGASYLLARVARAGVCFDADPRYPWDKGQRLSTRGGGPIVPAYYRSALAYHVPPDLGEHKLTSEALQRALTTARGWRERPRARRRFRNPGRRTRRSPRVSLPAPLEPSRKPSAPPLLGPHLRRAVRVATKRRKSLMLCCAQESSSSRASLAEALKPGDQAPGQPAATQQGTGEPAPPPSTTPDGGKIGPGVGLDASP